MSQRQGRQEPPIEHNLPCTLEELYRGSTRKMKISRTVVNAAGRPDRVSEILSIDIKPGWKKGTRITFPEKGESNLRSCQCMGHHHLIIIAEAVPTKTEVYTASLVARGML